MKTNNNHHFVGASIWWLICTNFVLCFKKLKWHYKRLWFVSSLIKLYNNMWMYLMKFDHFRLKIGSAFKNKSVISSLTASSSLRDFLFFTPVSTTSWRQGIFLRNRACYIMNRSFCRVIRKLSRVFLCLVMSPTWRQKPAVRLTIELHDQYGIISSDLLWHHSIRLHFTTKRSTISIKKNFGWWWWCDRDQTVKKRWCNDDHYFFTPGRPQRRSRSTRELE